MPARSPSSPRSWPRKVGLGEEVEIRIEVDETTPLGRAPTSMSVDPVHIRARVGLVRGPQEACGGSARSRPPTSSAATCCGPPTAGAAPSATHPSDADLTVPQRTAWEIYAVGRLAAVGYPAQRQRWLYAFRNRHGFTDDADGAFEPLWGGDDLAWADIAARPRRHDRPLGR